MRAALVLALLASALALAAVSPAASATPLCSYEGYNDLPVSVLLPWVFIGLEQRDGGWYGHWYRLTTTC